MKRFLAAVLVAAAAAPSAPAMESSVEKRIEKRVDEALRAGEARRREAVKEVLSEELNIPTPFAVIRKRITKKEGEEILGYFASDDLGGRDTGSAGHLAAAKEAAKRFEAAGLKAVGDDDTYFQHWKFGKKKTQNVVAFLPGETDELVVVGAHLDHLGQGPENPFMGRMHNKNSGKDDIYNGADDNGSGSTAVIEMAEAIASLHRPLKRGILFMLFAGEEKGLLGSRYYADHPIFPLDKTVAMINLDMVGRSTGEAPQHACLVYGAESSPELKETIEAANARAGMTLSYPPAGFLLQSSDQFSFYAKKIPVLFLFTGMHPEYHTPLDQVDKIDFRKIEEVAELAAMTTLLVADADDRPTYHEIPGGGGQKPKLGVTPTPVENSLLDDLGVDAKQGGVLLDAVMEDFPAGKAGLKAGDVVVEFAGKTFSRDNALFEFRQRILKAKAGTDVKIVVIRNGKRKTLTVRFDEEEK